MTTITAKTTSARGIVDRAALRAELEAANTQFRLMSGAVNDRVFIATTGSGLARASRHADGRWEVERLLSSLGCQSGAILWYEKSCLLC